MVGSGDILRRKTPERTKAAESKREATKNWLSFPTTGENGVALAASQTCSRSAEDMEQLGLIMSDFRRGVRVYAELQSVRER